MIATPVYWASTDTIPVLARHVADVVIERDVTQSVQIETLQPGGDLPPVARCVGGPIELELDDSGQATLQAQDADSGSYDPDGGQVTLTLRLQGTAGAGGSSLAFDCSDLGANINAELVVTDDEGNVESCGLDVVVLDKRAPVVTLVAQQPLQLAAGAGDCRAALPDFGGAQYVTVSDNCDGSPVLDWVVRDSGGAQVTAARLGPGSYTVEYTATDGEGNTSSPVTLAFEVIDDTPPGIDAQVRVIEVVASEDCSATVPAGLASDRYVVATDACDGAPRLAASVLDADRRELAEGAAIFLGQSYTVRYTATDASGNRSAPLELPLVVIDRTPPSIRLAVPQVQLEATTNCEASAPDLTESKYVTSRDNCDRAPRLSYRILWKASGQEVTTDTLPPGDYVVEYTAEDDAGNRSTDDSLALRVVDATAPTLTLQRSRLELSADDNCEASLPADLDGPGYVRASDTCDAAPVITHTVVDAGGNAVNATRVPLGSYEVRYVARDASGNASQAAVMELQVVDATPPAIDVRTDRIEVRADGGCSAAIPGDLTADAYVAATDACDSDPQIVATVLDANGDPLPAGARLVRGQRYRVRYTATDASGNSFTAPQLPVLEVIDVTPPAIALQRDTVTLHVGPNCAAQVPDLGGTQYVAAVSDNCDPQPAVGWRIFQGTQEIGTATLDAGSYTVVYTATDASGNRTTATLALEVVDDPPSGASESYLACEGALLQVGAERGVLANDSDPEGSAITAELLAQAEGGHVTLGADGSFEYEAADGFSGPDSFVYRPIDACGRAGAPVTVRIEVQPYNRAPVIDMPDSVEAFTGERLELRLVAGDLESEVLDLSVDAETLPEGASFDPASGILRWTPGRLQAGRYEVVFRACDDGIVNEAPPLAHASEAETDLRPGDGEQPCLASAQPRCTAHTVAITVVRSNEPPEFIEAAAAGVSGDDRPVVLPRTTLRVREGQSLDAAVFVRDPDGDPVRVLPMDLPPGAEFDREQLAIRWRTRLGDAGLYEAALLASDGLAHTVAPVQIEVEPARDLRGGSAGCHFGGGAGGAPGAGWALILAALGLARRIARRSGR